MEGKKFEHVLIKWERVSKEGQVEDTATYCATNCRGFLKKGEETGPKAQVEGGSWLGGDSRQVVSVSSAKEGKSLLGMWLDMWAGELKD